MRPGLIDQISYLYYIVAGPDHRPGNEALARFDELKRQLNQIEQTVLTD